MPNTPTQTLNTSAPRSLDGIPSHGLFSEPWSFVAYSEASRRRPPAYCSLCLVCLMPSFQVRSVGRGETFMGRCDCGLKVFVSNPSLLFLAVGYSDFVFSDVGQFGLLKEAADLRKSGEDLAPSFRLQRGGKYDGRYYSNSSYLCVWCSRKLMTIGLDLYGRPHTRCESCRTRSFLLHADNAHGVLGLSAYFEKLRTKDEADLVAKAQADPEGFTDWMDSGAWKPRLDMIRDRGVRLWQEWQEYGNMEIDSETSTDAEEAKPKTVRRPRERKRA